VASRSQTELGHGVRVTATSGGGLSVASPHLDLGWQLPAGRAPGTAVIFGGEAFEVTSRGADGGVTRWILRPWPEGETMRAVARLDAAGVAARSEHLRNVARRERGRRWSLLLLPLLPFVGLAPAVLQRRWSEDWGLAAGLASWLSAISETLVGTLGVVQGVGLAFGGGWFLPAGLHWLVAIAPVLAIEGIIRMTMALGGDVPVGSLLGSPLLLIGARTPTAPPPAPARRPPSILGVSLMAAAMTLAPRADQERWAARHEIRPVWLTVVGGGAELVGGLANLGRDLEAGGVPFILLDLLLIVEGGLRLGAAISGRAMGSVLGLALRPLYRRHLAG
jgi:hypothetical protein